jgi:hypothetical protein
MLKSEFGQTLPSRNWAEALLTPKQQIPPSANVKTRVFLDIFRSSLFDPRNVMLPGKQRAKRFAR